MSGCERPGDLRLSLLTLGDPNRWTGGYRYHRMMALAAPSHRAEIRFSSIPTLPWPAGVAPAAWTVRSLSRRSDVILLDSIAAAFAGPWIGRAGAPVVAVVHQTPGGVGHGPLRSVAQRALDDLAYRRAEGVVVAGEGLVEDLRRSGVSDRRVRVVPPGCDLPVAGGPPLDLRRGRATAILCVANWTPGKGILELLEAFAGLPEYAGTLWLVGATDADRGYAQKVRRRISSPDLTGRVVACGALPIEEVGRFYRSADVFALCSFVDAYGTAWAEAIAVGLPVVGWRTANLPRLAVDGREALMPEPGDRRGLSDALRTVTGDAAARERLAEGARRRAATLPTWRRSADLFFETVRELIGSSSRPPDRAPDRHIGDAPRCALGDARC